MSILRHSTTHHRPHHRFHYDYSDIQTGGPDSSPLLFPHTPLTPHNSHLKLPCNWHTRPAAGAAAASELLSERRRHALPIQTPPQ